LHCQAPLAAGLAGLNLKILNGGREREATPVPLPNKFLLPASYSYCDCWQNTPNFRKYPLDSFAFV
jgi:hypothetical protein